MLRWRVDAFHGEERLDPDDFTDAQAIAAIEQITRVLKINQLETITDDVVEAAASILVIGS